MLKGIAASSGVVVAKAYKMVQPVFEITKKSANVEEELARFELALIKTREDIESIKSKAVGRLSDDELAIFDAHIMVTMDPEFTGQMEEMIKNDAVNADYACHEVSSMFINMFESMEDAYFRERAADIKDVSYRLTCHILGLELANLSLIKEKVIIVAHDLTPSDTAQLNKEFTLGFATAIGGRTSHSAIMARSLEIPAVVGINGLLDTVNHGDIIALDAIEGNIGALAMRHL